MASHPADPGIIQEREKAAAEAEAKEKDIALGNPLLNAKSDFNVKRRCVVTCKVVAATLETRTTMLTKRPHTDGMTMLYSKTKLAEPRTSGRKNLSM